jgi:hypothetical protein
MLGHPAEGDAVPDWCRHARASRRLLAPAAALLALVPLVALSHGDAEWIQRDVEWRWCCGPEDCRRAAPGEVVTTPSGFLVPRTNQLFREGQRGLYYHHQNQDFWLCIRGGAVICLFVPEGMM